MKFKLEKFLKFCNVCGKHMKVILYNDHTYRGGHYFGKVSNRSRLFEYWECPKCYWK